MPCARVSLVLAIVVRCGYPLDALVGRCLGATMRAVLEGPDGGGEPAVKGYGSNSQTSRLQVAEHTLFFSTLIGLPGDWKFTHAVDRHGRPQWHFLGWGSET